MKLKSSEPFWLVKNGLLYSYPSLRNDIDTEVLIVGGGITGSLIAHQCVKDGFQTVVIDRREIAHGSTSASTSMLQYEIDIPLYKLIKQIGEKAAVECYKACYDSIDNLGKIVEQIESDCGFKKKDSLYFAASKMHTQWLITEYETRKKYDFPVRWLESEEIEKRYKLFNTCGGILSEQGGSLDLFQLAHDILAYNYKKGLTIYDKTDILETVNTKNGVTVKTEYGNTIKAKKIIYCTGYESVELIKDKFVKLLATYAIVGEIMEHEQPYLSDTLFWNTADPYIYMRTTDDNRLLIGGEDEEIINAAKRDSLLEKKSIDLENKLSEILPELKFRTDFVWAGTFGQTKDGLPYIGKHPDFQNAYFVLGFGGNGITFSVIAMDMISDFLKKKSHHLSEYFKFRR